MMTFLIKLKDKILGEDKTSPNINNLSGDELIDYCLKSHKDYDYLLKFHY